MAQLGSLIVTGTSRFLNKIYGTCTDGTNGTTKYLRQDGTWQVPPNDNTDTKVTQTNLSPTASTYYTIPFSKTCNTTEETDSLYKVQDLQVAFDGPDHEVSVNLSNSATSSYKFSQYAAGSMTLYQSTSSTDPPTAFMAITPNDITVTSYAQGTNNTWDGTNSSLKTAVSNARTTVTQTATNTNANYEVLFSGTADNTTRTEGARKTSTFTYNPNTKSVLIGTLKSGTTLGSNAVAFGDNVQASGKYSYAQGYGHVASSYGSHAEGESNTVDGRCAHAEGSFTTANGWYSHSEGDGTIAKFKSQHVFGDFNIEDPSTTTSSDRGNYVEIVGNGTTNNARSNARTLDWYGNEWLAGNLTLAGTTSDVILSGTNNTWDGTNTSLKSAIAAKSSVSFTQTVTSGLKLGEIKINNTSQDILTPFISSKVELLNIAAGGTYTHSVINNGYGLILAQTSATGAISYVFFKIVNKTSSFSYNVVAETIHNNDTNGFSITMNSGYSGKGYVVIEN